MTPIDVLNAVRVVVGLPMLTVIVGCSVPPPADVAPATKTLTDKPTPLTDNPTPPTAFASLTRAELMELFTVDTDLGLTSNEEWVSTCIQNHWEQRALCDLRGVSRPSPDWFDASDWPDEAGCTAYSPGNIQGPPSASLDIWPPSTPYFYVYEESSEPKLYWLYWTICSDNGQSNKTLSGWDVRSGKAHVLTDMMLIDGRPYGGRVALQVGDIPTDAERWLRRAQDEHASIASFARHILEMMSLGAPAELLADITAAQFDEVRHTQLALKRAHELGATASLGALDTTLPPRTGALDIAVGVAVEGCVNETLAALSIAAQAQIAHPDERDLLTTIAEDETRHATLAWRTLTWLWPTLSTAERAHVRQQATASAPSDAMAFIQPCFDALAA